MVKYVLIGITSAGVGAACGYFVGSTLSRKKWQKQADIEIESIKKLYANDKTSTKSDKHECECESKQIVENKKLKKEMMDYTKMYLPKEDDKIVNNGEIEHIPEVNTGDYIYYITNEDYATSTFDAMELTFWADAVITDSDDNPLYDDDIHDFVADLVNNAAFADTDIVYIRNDIREIDYEVTKDSRKFCELKNNYPKED